MHPIVTIAAGVALGIMVAAGLLLLGYTNLAGLSKGLIAFRLWVWRARWWFAAAAGLAIAVFVYVQAHEEKKRRYLEEVRQQETEESWRRSEENRKRARQECDAARKWVEEQCEPFRAKAEKAQGDQALIARVALSACEVRERLKLPQRPDCTM